MPIESRNLKTENEKKKKRNLSKIKKNKRRNSNVHNIGGNGKSNEARDSIHNVDASAKRLIRSSARFNEIRKLYFFIVAQISRIRFFDGWLNG
jgi:hypothetical protein